MSELRDVFATPVPTRPDPSLKYSRLTNHANVEFRTDSTLSTLGLENFMSTLSETQVAAIEALIDPKSGMGYRWNGLRVFREQQIREALDNATTSPPAVDLGDLTEGTA